MGTMRALFGGAIHISFRPAQGERLYGAPERWRAITTVIKQARHTTDQLVEVGYEACGKTPEEALKLLKTKVAEGEDGWTWDNYS
ncbi:hypothetical protein [Candidatus Darwinibacter acetoxidans]|jgi:hypothetical protein